MFSPVKLPTLQCRSHLCEINQNKHTAFDSAILWYHLDHEEILERATNTTVHPILLSFVIAKARKTWHGRFSRKVRPNNNNISPFIPTSFICVICCCAVQAVAWTLMSVIAYPSTASSSSSSI